MHKIYKVKSFDIVAPYTLELIFDDGTKNIINFQKVLKGDLFGRLSDINYFNQVKIDEEIQTIVWPNGADFDPSTLHDWQVYEKELIKLTEKWK